MVFEISRTTNPSSDQPPCDGAFRRDCLRTEHWSMRTEEAFDALKGRTEGPFRSKGRNHRETPFGIARDFPDSTWFIEIKGLEELIKLAAQHGEIAVHPSGRIATNTPEIEILDFLPRVPPCSPNRKG